LNGISTNVLSSLTSLWVQIFTLQTATTNQTYSSGTITFNDNVSVTGTLQGLNTTIYSYLSGLTSNVQS
jgi:hypothetical protein